MRVRAPNLHVIRVRILSLRRVHHWRHPSHAHRSQTLQATMTDMDVDTGSITIDEDLQSRQMAVYGRESMQKLKAAAF